jgi:hypothetical protein
MGSSIPVLPSFRVRNLFSPTEVLGPADAIPERAGNERNAPEVPRREDFKNSLRSYLLIVIILLQVRWDLSKLLWGF